MEEKIQVSTQPFGGMREMTGSELHMWYKLHTWPCGHGGEYRTGPRGGISVNVECPTCHMKLNVIDPEMRLSTGGFGQVLWAPADYVIPKDYASVYQVVGGGLQLHTAHGQRHMLSWLDRLLLRNNLTTLEKLNKKYDDASQPQQG